LSIPPAGPSPSQPLPQRPDIPQTASELSRALGEFMDDLQNAREHPHLVDSPQALEGFAGKVRELHTIVIQAGG